MQTKITSIALIALFLFSCSDDPAMKSKRAELAKLEKTLSKLEKKQAKHEAEIGDVRKMAPITLSKAFTGGNEYVVQGAIDLEMENASDTPLSAVEFNAILTSNNKVLKDSDLRVTFERRLKQGESHRGVYSPFGWRDLQISDDSMLDLKITNLFDDDGKPLAPVMLTREERKEVVSLRNRINKLNKEITNLKQ